MHSYFVLIAAKKCSSKSIRHDGDPLPGSPSIHDPRCLCIVEPWRPIDSVPRIANFPLVVLGFACPFSALCNWNRCVLPCSRCGCSCTIWLDSAARDFISRTSLSSWQLANIPTGVCLWGGRAGGAWLLSCLRLENDNDLFYIIVTSLLASLYSDLAG